MEKSLKEIARIAKEKEDENWEFRSFLKSYDVEIEDLGSIVHKLYHPVYSRYPGRIPVRPVNLRYWQ